MRFWLDFPESGDWGGGFLPIIIKELEYQNFGPLSPSIIRGGGVSPMMEQPLPKLIK